MALIPIFHEGGEVHFLSKNDKVKFMFTPKTDRIKSIAEEQKRLIEKLDSMLTDRTTMYIDYANIRPWSNKLRFHIDIKRLKQFLDSFSQIEKVHFYQGTLVGDKQSEEDIKDIEG